LWKGEDNTDTISWIAVYFPSYSDGTTVCHKYDGDAYGLAYGESRAFHANCYDDVSNPIRLFIEVFVHDGSFKDEDSIQIPESCKASKDKGKKVAYEIYIPCEPCQQRRYLEGLLAKSDAGISHPNYNARSIPIPQKKKFTRADQVAYTITKRRTQEEYDGPPVPFEMEFTIVSTGGVSGASDSSLGLLAAALLSFIGMVAFIR
jgi:hypothetical protein